MSDQVIPQEQASEYLASILHWFFRAEIPPSPDRVFEWLTGMGQEGVIAFQLALKGTGCATADFIPDGDFGEETKKSLENLFEAAEVR